MLKSVIPKSGSLKLQANTIKIPVQFGTSCLDTTAGGIKHLRKLVGFLLLNEVFYWHLWLFFFEHNVAAPYASLSGVGDSFITLELSIVGWLPLLYASRPWTNIDYYKKHLFL